MATYVAVQLLYADGYGLVEAGKEFDLDLPPGVNPPPEEVAVLKKGRRKSSAPADDSAPDLTMQ